MSVRLPRLLQRLIIIVTAAILAIPATAGEVPEGLVDGPVVKSKKSQVLPQAATEFLQQRDGETARVWVFFTDKGVFTKEEFDSKAAALTFSEKVRARRAKTGRDQVLFVDLPVVQNFVDEVAGLGAELRWKSKWLNAASFDMPTELLDDVAELRFVYEIRPVAGRNFTPRPVEELRFEDLPDQSLAPDVLNYGIAQAQLEQIGIPAAHAQGLDGSGVTLAIFDTGYRKTHEAFANHYLEGRVLAEYDFVFDDGNTANEPEDWSSAWNHGTYIWSTAGGFLDGTIYGPAYRANFILCKTEDVQSETPVEEDNWVAAMEWVDSLGADVITSSLTYSAWYASEDYDGQTATITIAANTATALGIVVCNANGNGGPGASTMRPPADAFEILACGAVDNDGDIASFSSRGPTYDGRIKPEVCAQGVATACATTTTDGSYGNVSGTSLSTPLVAGAACLLIQARPQFPPQLIRQALMETADNALTPNNTYGWGIMNLEAALNWGANFTADVTQSDAPQTIQFTDLSTMATPTWEWNFGDGDSSFVQNPSHTYTEAGAYNVSLTIDTEYGPLTSEKLNYIILLGDTLTFKSDSVFAGQTAVMSVELSNSQPLNRIMLPFTYGGNSLLAYDSISLGNRTTYFERLAFLTSDPVNKRFTVELVADYGGGAPPLTKGTGEILKIFFSTDPQALGGVSDDVDSTNFIYSVALESDVLSYAPEVYSGSLSTIVVKRGDANYSQTIDIVDLTYIVDYLFKGGPFPVSLQAGDADADLSINIDDITYLVEYLFKGGPPPPTP